MELEDLKNMWESQSAKDPLAEKYTAEKLNSILMDATTTMEKIERTNRKWWKLSRVSTVGIFCVILLNLLLFSIDKRFYEHFYSILAFQGFILLYSLLGLWLSYEQSRIFDVAGADNLKSAIEISLKKFSRFYSLSVILSMVTMPPVIYVGLLMIKLSLGKIYLLVDLKLVLISLGITIVVMIASHLYHKKTYFSWIASLREKLIELKEN